MWSWSSLWSKSRLTQRWYRHQGSLPWYQQHCLLKSTKSSRGLRKTGRQRTEWSPSWIQVTKIWTCRGGWRRTSSCSDLVWSFLSKPDAWSSHRQTSQLKLLARRYRLLVYLKRCYLVELPPKQAGIQSLLAFRTKTHLLSVFYCLQGVVSSDSPLLVQHLPVSLLRFSALCGCLKYKIVCKFRLSNQLICWSCQDHIPFPFHLSSFVRNMCNRCS